MPTSVPVPVAVPSKSLAELNRFGHIKGNRNPNVHAWLVASTPTYIEYGSIVIEQKYSVIYLKDSATVPYSTTHTYRYRYPCT